MAIGLIDPFLSMGDLALDRTQVPVSTHLLALCGGSDKKIRSLQRILAGASTNCPLSPLGRERLGSGTLKKIPAIVARIFHSFLFLSESAGHFIPIHHIPERCQKFGAAVLIFKIVSVLPNIDAENGSAFYLGDVHEGIVLIGG